MAAINEDTILVGLTNWHGKENAILVVGRKRMNQSVEIINTIQGEEAVNIYEKLVTPKEVKQ